MNAHSLQLLFQVPFEYRIRLLGMLGVFTNAFLSKSLDNSSHENWYDHPLLAEWRCEFRRESDLTLAAEWLAEWLVLLRMQGADILRLHFEEYDQIQQLSLGVSGKTPYAVLSAWRKRIFRETCLSSWTRAAEYSLARRMYDNLQGGDFKFSSGSVPGELSTDLFLETARVLDSAPQVRMDFSILCAHLDELFATGEKAGYVMADLPKDSATRVKFAEAHFAGSENAYTHKFAPFPCFPNNLQADPMRHVFIDAGILYGQMAQVPERTPLNHHDDENRGPIFPASDSDGKIYDLLFEQLWVLGKSWLQLCYSPWKESSVPNEECLTLRDPVDIAYLSSFHINMSGKESISWARPKPPPPPTIYLRGEHNEIVPQTGWWESAARPNGQVMHYFEAGQRFPPDQFTKIGPVAWSYNSDRQPPAP